MLTFFANSICSHHRESYSFIYKTKKVQFHRFDYGRFSLFLQYLFQNQLGWGVQLFRTFSVDTRIQNAIEGVQLWTKNPILGVGYNRIRYEKAGLGLTGKYDVSHAASSYHSSFVTMLVAGGALGLLGLLGMLGMLGRISIPSFYYILFLSILSCGDNALLHPFILFLLLKLLAFEFNQSSLE